MPKTYVNQTEADCCKGIRQAAAYLGGIEAWPNGLGCNIRGTQVMATCNGMMVHLPENQTQRAGSYLVTNTTNPFVAAKAARVARNMGAIIPELGKEWVEVRA
jgi:hypothetical protein